MLIYDFIFSRKITECVLSLNAVKQMFPCCYTDKISALVTCCILDQNQNPHLRANTCTPQSSTPQIQMLFVSRGNLLSSLR